MLVNVASAQPGQYPIISCHGGREDPEDWYESLIETSNQPGAGLKTLA